MEKNKNSLLDIVKHFHNRRNMRAKLAGIGATVGPGLMYGAKTLAGTGHPLALAPALLGGAIGVILAQGSIGNARRAYENNQAGKFWQGIDLTSDEPILNQPFFDTLDPTLEFE